MIGWIVGIDSFTRIGSSGINMSFPTAVMFLLSAIGLFFIYRSVVNSEYTTSSLILSAITLMIFLINITIFTGSIIGIRTGMENLFVGAHSPEVLNITIAGMPALPTMAGFVFFGLTIVLSLVQKTNRQKIIGLFGLTILAIGLFAVLGYVLVVPLLYYQISPNSVPMASNTAISFVLLGCGLYTISLLKVLHET